MSIKHVLRPDHIKTTPSLIANDLGIQTRRWPGWRKPPNFEADLFMVYPHMDEVSTTRPEVYIQLRHFFSRHKPGQRSYIQAAGIKVPEFWQNLPNRSFPDDTSFVVRPLRHSGGEDYKVTQNPVDFVPGNEYISLVFPKQREYRILFALGKPILFWQKVPIDGQGVADGWGGEGTSSFLTIDNWDGSYLFRYTTALADLQNHGIIKTAHVVAVDIMYADKDYRVLEYNCCPGLTINRNRKTLVDYLKANWKT